MDDTSDNERSPSPKNDTRRTDVVIGIIRRANQVLLSRRRKGDAFADLWEFPGGKREDAESLQQALVRELREELAIEVRLLKALATIDHDYPTMRIRLHPWLCEIEAGEPIPLASQEVRWIAASELAGFSFPAGNAKLLKRVMDVFAEGH